jgi:hypothetical protein
MATKRDQLCALARICQRLGGRLEIVSRRAFIALFANDDALCIPGSAGSRFEYAIHWKKKIIYAVRGTKHIGFLIHEAGHVFADRHHPDNDKCNEWKWLGWEIAVAQRIGAWSVWSRQSGNYYLGDGIDRGIGKDKDWYDLSAKDRRAVVADRIAYAKKIGIISKMGAPRSVR